MGQPVSLFFCSKSQLDKVYPLCPTFPVSNIDQATVTVLAALASPSPPYLLRRRGAKHKIFQCNSNKDRSETGNPLMLSEKVLVVNLMSTISDDWGILKPIGAEKVP